jgi:hypothetical protein
MFISRIELLPEDETTAEHDEAKHIEAQLIETDRTTRTDGEPGLFKGAFCSARLQIQGPIHDDEDGVLRCPMCTWEMEDGECGHCGFTENPEFSEAEDYETTGSSRSVTSHSSILDPEDDPDHVEFENPFLQGQPPAMQDDIREWAEWARRIQAARRARRAMRENERRDHRGRASTVETEDTDATMRRDYDHYPESRDYSEEDEEMAAFLEGHPHDGHRQNTYTADPVDEDEEMSSTVDDEDQESTTRFYQAAILARDRGLNPRFESDVSTDGEAETATNGGSGSSSDETTESESDTTEPTPTVQRLASRPARIVIDSDDESSSDSSSEEDDETPSSQTNADEDEDSSDDDSTPSPPRPAAVRQARVQMHRGRRGGRGRPRRRG